MKKIRFTYLLLSLPIAGLILSSCGNLEGNASQLHKKQSMPYPVITIPSESVTAYDTYPTSLEGIVNSEVRAKTSAYITAVLVDAGQKVRKGQTLFRLKTESISQDAA